MTIHDPNDWSDHARLLDYGFDSFTSTPVLTADEPLWEVPVLTGTCDTVGAAAKEPFSYPLAECETAVVRLHLPRFVFAPVEEGSCAGEAVIVVNGKEAGRTELYWTGSVQQAKISKFDALKRRLGG